MSELQIEDLLGPLDFDPDTLKLKYLEERDKRVRQEGNDQYVEVTAAFSHYQDDPYVEPGFTRESPYLTPLRSRSLAVDLVDCLLAHE